MGWGSVGLRDALHKAHFTRYDEVWVGPGGEVVIDSIVRDIEEGRITHVVGDDMKRIPLTADMVVRKIQAEAPAHV